MSALDIFANMARGWNRDPSGVALGSERTGVSAALWTHDIDDVQEVWSEPNPDHHLIAWQMSRFSSDTFNDERLVYSGHHRPGTFNIVSAGVRPRAVIAGKFQVLHAFLPVALLRSALDDQDVCPSTSLELIDPACKHDPAIERIGREVLFEMQEGLPLSQLRIDTLGQDLAIHLLRRWSNVAGTTALVQRQANGGLAPWQVRRSTEYLADNLDKDVTLEELAAIVRLSPFHFCRAFKKSVGLTPTGWQLSRRIERAQELMRDPETPLLQVALAVGYQSQGAFGNAFRRITGETPAAWRKRQWS
jgi:AraC family transcriptional regulator